MVYDTLHKSILQLDWKDVDAALATEAGLEMAKDNFKDDFPLHMACELKAPESTILSLLDAHRPAAAIPGRYGEYPLHLAAQQKLSPAVLVALIRAYPEALDHLDSSKNVPRDYEQRNDLCREALSRPTACWIEDIDKEEYLERVITKRTQLRQKIMILRSALEMSKERRGLTEGLISGLEPRLAAQRDELCQLATIEEQMDELYSSNETQMQKMRERIKLLSDELCSQPDEEESMMRSLMKRTYMQGVQRQYEKLLQRTDQIRKDIHSLRVATNLKNESATQSSTDSD